MRINVFSDLLRTAVYLMVALQFAILAYVYYNGYFKHKASHIIQNLQLLFFYLAVFFVLIGAVAFTSTLNREFSDGVRVMLLAAGLPVLFYANKFMYWSFHEDNKTEIKKEFKVGKKLKVIHRR